MKSKALHPLRIAALLLLLIPVLSLRDALAVGPTPDFLLMWGSTGTGAGQFQAPTAVAVDENGFVYVCESTNHRVQKFDPDGNFIATWGSYGSSNGKLNQPHGICSDGQGSIWVADAGNHRVQKFTTAGTYVTKIGSAQGSGNGEFNAPRGVAVDTDGNLYVADTFNDRIQKFGSNGAFVTKWGTPGSGDGQFNKPSQLIVDSAGKLFVSELNNHRVQVFNINGVFQYKIGSLGSGNLQFNSPVSIGLYGGDFYIVDGNNHRIQKATKAGTYLTQWGTYGIAPNEFSYPRGLAVNGTGEICVADTDNNRIQKFGVGSGAPQNILTVGTGTGLPALGAISIPVSLASLQSASGLEIVLDDTPDWFHVTGVTLKGRASSMSVSFVDGTGLHILVYSPTGGLMSFGSGETMDLTGTIDPSAVVGDSAVLAVSSVLMADSGGDPATIDSMNGVLYIARIAGDVNGDNLLDAGDHPILRC